MYRLRARLRPFTLPLITILLVAFSWAQWTNPHVHAAADTELHLHVGLAQDHRDHHHADHHDGASYTQVDLSASAVPAKKGSMTDATLIPILLALLMLVPVTPGRVPVQRDDTLHSLSPPHLTPPLRAPPRIL
jgi:hypothetical protein